MGIFSKTPFEKKINEYIGGFLWKGYYKDLLKLNGLYKPYFGKSDMCIGNDVQHILKKRFELEGWDVTKFEFEFYLLLKELIYINNNEGFTNKVCSECNNSLSNMHIVYCPNCSHDFLEEYNINYSDLHQIKIVFPNTANPYKNLNIYKTLDKELKQYIDGKARYGMKKSTNDKKDALKSTKKTNPKTKPKSNSKNKTYKYGRYDALNNGKCPNCGKTINRKAIRCIHCNYNFIENKVMPKTKGFEKVSGTSEIIEHNNYIGGYPKRHNSKPKKNVSSLYFHTISDIPKTSVENSSDKSKSKKCPNCGKLIKKSATKCIYCDYDLKVKRMENKPSYESVVDNNRDEKNIVKNVEEQIRRMLNFVDGVALNLAKYLITALIVIDYLIIKKCSVQNADQI